MITENTGFKIIKEHKFNMFFNKKSGTTIVYGEKLEDDPDFSPSGPLIADIELSTICFQGCKFCYKSNHMNGKNMSFEVFRDIFHKFPRTLTQIAFGIGDIDANPDLVRIMEYCRDNQYQFVVPNVTINGYRMTDRWYDFLASTCGAVAVSYYDRDICFNAVKELTSRGLTQVNIHSMLSESTVDSCSELIDLVLSDSRLMKLNAVVFLMLKQKGRGRFLNIVDENKYNKFVNKLMGSGINFGFDSCGAGRLLNFGISKDIEMMIEPCESGLFSMYINTDGEFFPCSFTEGEPGWETGIPVNNCNDFINDIWFSSRVVSWREKLLANNRRCPRFKI